MSWKIDQIEFKNFKFFKKEFTLPLERKHLLVYGENGSGKSSIHWGFHTILQSCLKSVDETNKYFDSANSENLRNCFANDNEEAYIKISFSDDEGHSNDFTLAKDNNNESNNPFLKATVVASDFLNYRYLSSLFDFRNSMDNDIFSSFEKEILPYLYNKKQIQLIFPDNSRRKTQELVECWKCIKEWQDYLANQEASNDEKETYSGLCTMFENIINSQLTDIINIANKKLKEIFHIPVSISVTYDGLTNHLKDYNYRPKLILTAQLTYTDLHPNSVNIYHLRTFFNEAKLSCIALAIRLAIVDRRLSFANINVDFSKLLFIDDLLLSLDMSNRRLIIRILLDYSDRYQMILFTHDRAFFHLIQDEVALRDEDANWKCFEFYQPEESIGMNSFPEPCFRENGKHYIDALNLYKLNQYPAAALEIRKGFEALLCKWYPKNKIKEHDKQRDEIINLTLAQLIKKWKLFCNRFHAPVNFLEMAIIDKYRDELMNPLSHNNIYAPIYRQEIKDCMSILKKAETEITLLNVAYDADVLKTEFSLTLSVSKYKNVTVDFYPKEVWRILKVNDDKYYENIRVIIKTCDTANIVKGNYECSLECLYNKIVKYLKTDLFSFDKIGEYITNSSNVKLSEF